MFTSEDSGLGAFASSTSLADRRSARACSMGPLMFIALRWALFLLELDLELFAIVKIGMVLFVG